MFLNMQSNDIFHIELHLNFTGDIFNLFEETFGIVFNKIPYTRSHQAEYYS